MKEYEVLKNARILYVEDEEDVLKFTSMVLEDYTGELYIAKNGEEALEILAHQKIDLLITDILMPKMSGIELIKEMRQRYGRSISTIITTAHAETHYLLEAIDLGVDGYVLKPIDVEDLLRVMEKALLPKMQAHELASKNLLINAISVFVGGKKIEIIKYLLDNCDQDNVFHGSYEDIIAALNVSKPTVVKTFKKLMDTGLLTRIKNKIYRLHPDISGSRALVEVEEKEEEA